MKLALVTLALAIAVGVTMGLTYAALNRSFNLPIEATVTVKIASPGDAADVNQDGVVDVADLIIVTRNINMSPLTDTRADVDKDGIVGILDLAFVARFFDRLQ